jgi:type IV pilus assembly protein PilM
VAHSLFTKLFPIPTFLTLSSVAIDISDQSIKFTELKRKKGELILGRYGMVILDPGIVVSGKIVDPARLTKALQDLKTKEKLECVRVALPEEQIYLFELKIPKVSPKEIRPTIELSLEEHVPLKLDEVIFDYIITHETESDYELQVSAIPAEYSKSYYSVFADAGLRPLSFELEAQAIARAVVNKKDPGTFMVVDFGETRTGLSIVSNGIVHFTITLEIGGVMIAKAIEKDFSISFKEAEALKRQVGLSRKDENKELFSVLIYSISILRDEINKNFIYWHTHKDDGGHERPKIQEIILCGGNANIFGLTDYLSASLHTKVTVANPWINVNSLSNYIPPININEALTYATALGLALGDFEQND